MGMLLCLMLFLALETVSSDTSEETEINRNTLEVQFYQMTKSKWNNRAETFSTLLVAELNRYCSSDSESCGIHNWTDTFAFMSTDVKFTDDTPKLDESNLAIFYYVRFSTSIPEPYKNRTTYVLSKRALTDATTNIRKDIADELGYDIVKIADEEYSAKLDKTMNTIMICVGFGVLLIVIIMAVAGTCYSTRQEERQMKENKRRWQFNSKRHEQGYTEFKKQKMDASPSQSRVHPSKNTDVEKGVWKTDASAQNGRQGYGLSRSPTMSYCEVVPPIGNHRYVNQANNTSTTEHHHHHQQPNRASMFMAQVESPTVSVENNELNNGDGYGEDQMLEIPDVTRRGHVLPPDGEEKRKRRKHRKKHKKDRKHRHHHHEDDVDSKEEDNRRPYEYDNPTYSGVQAPAERQASPENKQMNIFVAPQSPDDEPVVTRLPSRDSESETGGSINGQITGGNTTQMTEL